MTSDAPPEAAHFDPRRPAPATGIHGDARALGAGSATVLDPATAPGALDGECSPAANAAAIPRLGPQPMATDHSPFLSSVGDLAGIIETVARASTQDGTR